MNKRSKYYLSDDGFNNNIDRMEADMGLFYQLLEMVKGEWVDSIQGICDYLMVKLNVIGVILSVFDRKYNQFIFVSYSIKDNITEILSKNGIELNSRSVISISQKLYEINKRILVDGYFNKDDIIAMAEQFLSEDREKAIALVKELKLDTVNAVQIVSSKNNFKCFIHLLCEEFITGNDFKIENHYITQLNIALEIVFLVRELYIKASHDSLTKLYNHKQGLILLEREMFRLQRRDKPLIVVMIDIDSFKQVNDNFGHQTGDNVLKTICRIMTGNTRKSDILSRYGGEEFLLVFPDTDLKDAIIVLKRIKNEIQEHKFFHSGTEFSVTASFGVVEYIPNRFRDVNELVDKADKYLYKAKKLGKNRIEY